jgi:hypothetical protein
MAYSFFNLIQPNLVYAQRLTFRANPAELPADPQNAYCPEIGEWLTLAANQLVRPGHPVSPTVSVANTKLAFPLLDELGRTDVQSSAVAGVNTTDGPGAKMTVVVHKGAIATTSMFAQFSAAGGATELTYAVGDDLVLATFLDSAGNTRSGLCQASAVVVTTPVDEGDLIAINNNLVLARVVRTPYSVSGFGKTDGRGFPAQPTVGSPGGTRRVMDIIIL